MIPRTPAAVPGMAGAVPSGGVRVKSATGAAALAVPTRSKRVAIKRQNVSIEMLFL